MHIYAVKIYGDVLKLIADDCRTARTAVMQDSKIGNKTVEPSE
jgi:hypothetical protein